MYHKRLGQPRVGIDASLQERFGQLEVAGGLLHVLRRLRMTRLRRPLHVENAVERRRAAVAGELGIGAALEQTLREIEVSVDGGDEQRRGAIGRARLVDVGARVEKRHHRVVMAVARGQQQRGQAAVRADELGVAERLRLVAVVDVARSASPAGACRRGRRRWAANLAARSFWIAAMRVFRARLSAASCWLRSRRSTTRAVTARFGAATGQRLDDVGTAGGGGEHQRRLTPLRFAQVDVRTAIEECYDDVEVSGSGGKVQRRRSGCGLLRRRCLRVEQTPHDGRPSAGGRDVKRRVSAEPRSRRDIGARGNHDLRELVVSAVGSPVQRRHAIALRPVDVGALLNQRFDGRKIAARGGVGNACVADACVRRSDDGQRQDCRESQRVRPANHCVLSSHAA